MYYTKKRLAVMGGGAANLCKLVYGMGQKCYVQTWPQGTACGSTDSQNLDLLCMIVHTAGMGREAWYSCEIVLFHRMVIHLILFLIVIFTIYRAQYKGKNSLGTPYSGENKP